MSSYESNQSTLSSSSSSITLSYTQLTEKEIKIISSLSKLINNIIKKNFKKKKNILSKKIKKDKFFFLYIQNIYIYNYIYKIIKFKKINI